MLLLSGPLWCPKPPSPPPWPRDRTWTYFEKMAQVLTVWSQLGLVTYKSYLYLYIHNSFIIIYTSREYLSRDVVMLRSEDLQAMSQLCVKFEDINFFRYFLWRNHVLYDGTLIKIYESLILHMANRLIVFIMLRYDYLQTWLGQVH